MDTGSHIGYHPTMVGGAGGYGWGGNNIAELLVIAALFGRRGFGEEGHGHGDCANARFLALENGISQTQDMIANQNVLGAISKAETTAAVRFDAIQANINANSTQALLASERTNGNIAEVKFQGALNTQTTKADIAEAKFQNALNFQALGKQLGDCCCELKMAIGADGDTTRALINANVVQGLRDKLQDEKLENSQLKQTGYLSHLINKVDNLSSAVGIGINNGVIANTKTNTGGVQG